jgi:AraC-like DNA-binding protein
MSSRLDEVRNWEQLAETSHYSANLLAKRCKISTRQLERHFLHTKNQSPHQWLNELRQKQALKLTGGSCLAKEVAERLGYKQASHFSREFKRFHGFPPSKSKEHLQESRNVAFR